MNKILNKDQNTPKGRELQTYVTKLKPHDKHTNTHTHTHTRKRWTILFAATVQSERRAPQTGRVTCLYVFYRECEKPKFKIQRTSFSTADLWFKIKYTETTYRFAVKLCLSPTVSLIPVQSDGDLVLLQTRSGWSHVAASVEWEGAWTNPLYRTKPPG